jgi:hypothetical protein
MIHTYVLSIKIQILTSKVSCKTPLGITQYLPNDNVILLYLLKHCSIINRIQNLNKIPFNIMNLHYFFYRSKVF